MRHIGIAVVGCAGGFCLVTAAASIVLSASFALGLLPPDVSGALRW